MRRSSRAVAAAVLLLVLAPAGSFADLSPLPATPLDPETMQALAGYFADPRANRSRVLALGRDSAGLPPMALLAIADANLRAGRLPTARRFFQDAVEANVGPPWAMWAKLGLAFTAVGLGDFAEARVQFQGIADARDVNSAFARLMVGLLAADAGSLDALRLEPSTPPGLRSAIALGAAYARYWRGEYAGASAAFAAVAAADPQGPLADDGRYGAAWSRLRSGEQAAAIDQLHELAGGASNRGAGRASNALVDLDQHAVLRAGFRRYWSGRPRLPDDAGFPILDEDGVALAHAALRRLHRPSAAAAAPIPVRETGNDVAAPLAPDELIDHARPAPAPQPAPRTTPRPQPPPPSHGWLVALLLLTAAGVALLLRRVR